MTDRIVVIAEAGVNHNGSAVAAMELVEVAADAGADIVKFQTWKTDEAIAECAPKPGYQKRTTGTETSQYEMIQGLELNEEEHSRIAQHCSIRDIEFLSSPFDLPSLGFLVDGLHVRRLKIASCEIDNGPLLLAAAKSGLPVLLSTGMCTLGEVEAALAVLAYGYADCKGNEEAQDFWKAYGSPEGGGFLREKVTLLHCTTEYPAAMDAVNLRAMDTLESAFAVPVGFSDHTPGIMASVAAAARGAVVIEKHVTLDRGLPGPDHAASLEPDELRDLVRAIRDIERTLGDGRKVPVGIEWENRKLFRKRLVARRKISAGECFTSENVAVKRSDNGSSPMGYWRLLGSTAVCDYEPDDGIEG